MLGVDHGSIMHSEKSVTPRLRIASCQRGSLRTTSSADRNSSNMIDGWMPGIRRHSRTSLLATATMPS